MQRCCCLYLALRQLPLELLCRPRTLASFDCDAGFTFLVPGNAGRCMLLVGWPGRKQLLLGRARRVEMADGNGLSAAG